jgi:hypothetical protein
MWSPMKELFILIAHALTTLVKLAQPGGVRSVVAQSLALRHQLLVLQRRRQRAPRPVPPENPLCRWNLPRGSVQPVGATVTLFELLARSAGTRVVAADLGRISEWLTAHDV